MNDVTIEDRAADIASRTEASVGKMAADAKDKVGELASQAGAATEKLYGEARDQARGMVDTVTRSVERQPEIALLVVGLLCGAVGYLLARR